jgi:hypothetical protein
VLKQLVNNVLKNPFIWGMALTYFFIYIVRQVGDLSLCNVSVCAERGCGADPATPWNQSEVQAVGRQHTVRTRRNGCRAMPQDTRQQL